MQTFFQYREQRKQAEKIYKRSRRHVGNDERRGSDLYSVRNNLEADTTLNERQHDTGNNTAINTTTNDDSPTPQRHYSDETLQEDSVSTSPGAEKDQERDEKVEVKIDSHGRDSADPQSWSRTKKYWTVTILFLLVFSQGWVSTCDSDVTAPASKSFGVSDEADVLATALFLWGIAAGSLVVGPLSEIFGRNPVYLVPSIFYLCFTLGDALAPNYGAQITFRFLAGLFASPVLSIYGGSLADLFESEERQYMWPVFALSPLLSPILSPVVGGYVSQYTDWRWVYWIGLALSGAIYIIAFLFLPETSSPMMIQWRTHHMREVSGNPNYTCDMETGDSLLSRLGNNLSRPAKFLTTEPITIALGFYLVVVYVVIFTFLNGFEFVFTDTYFIFPGKTSLAFVGICLGAFISTPLGYLITYLHRRYFNKSGNESPETLLIPAIVASPFFGISIFWIGWTNFASISPWSDYTATILFGYAMTALFVYSYSYIIRIYGTWSSSALGSITVARYFVGAGMLVASRPLYKGLGVHWAMTFLGCLGVLCAPVPWLLYRYGRKLRSKSKFIEPEEDKEGGGDEEKGEQGGEDKSGDSEGSGEENKREEEEV